jgi:hypothetical protein
VGGEEEIRNLPNGNLKKKIRRLRFKSSNMTKHISEFSDFKIFVLGKSVFEYSVGFCFENQEKRENKTLSQHFYDTILDNF